MDDDLVLEFCKETGKDFSQFIKEAAFSLGCFILPKYVIKSFSLDMELIKKPSNKLSRAQMNLKKKVNQFFDLVQHKVRQATSHEKIAESKNCG